MTIALLFLATSLALVAYAAWRPTGKRIILREQAYSVVTGIYEMPEPATILTQVARWLQHQRSPVSPRWFLALVAFLTALAFVLGISASSVALAFLLAVAAAVVPFFAVAGLAARRRRAIILATPTTLDQLAQAPAAYRSPEVLIQQMTPYMPQATRREFERLLADLRTNISPVEAYGRFVARIDSPYLQHFGQLALAATQHGIQFREALQALLLTYHDDRKLSEKYRTETLWAERMTWLFLLAEGATILYKLTTAPQDLLLFVSDAGARATLPLIVLATLAGVFLPLFWRIEVQFRCCRNRVLVYNTAVLSPQPWSQWPRQ